MGSSKIKAIVLLKIIFFVTTLPCMAWEKVSFRHKTTKPPKFKLECRKIQGKHDAHPIYKCYDIEGNTEDFDPGKEWEEVTIENVCFRHKVRDHIRGCIKIRGKQDNIEHVGCMNSKGDLNIFPPDSSKWEELLAEDPDCKPHTVEMDVPRGTINLQNNEPDRNVNGEPGNNTKFAIGLIDLGTITTVLIPLLYTAGWSFAYHYFERFHLGMQGLNIQREYLFLYSFWVIKDQLFITIAAILFLVLIYVGIRLLFRLATSEEKNIRQYIFQSVGLIMVPAVVLGLFTLFYQLGDCTADDLYKKQAKGDFPSYPRVKVYLNEKAAEEAGAIANEWSNGCYRLLLRNKEHLYIFFSGGYPEEIATEVIPQSQVHLVRILPLYQSSEKCN